MTRFAFDLEEIRKGWWSHGGCPFGDKVEDQPVFLSI